MRPEESLSDPVCVLRRYGKSHLTLGVAGRTTWLASSRWREPPPSPPTPLAPSTVLGQKNKAGHWKIQTTGFRRVVLGSQHHSGTCQKPRSSDLILDPLMLKVWEWGPAIDVSTNLPNDSDSCQVQGALSVVTSRIASCVFSLHQPGLDPSADWTLPRHIYPGLKFSPRSSEPALLPAPPTSSPGWFPGFTARGTRGQGQHKDGVTSRSVAIIRGKVTFLFCF